MKPTIYKFVNLTTKEEKSSENLGELLPLKEAAAEQNQEFEIISMLQGEERMAKIIDSSLIRKQKNEENN